MTARLATIIAIACAVAGCALRASLGTHDGGDESTAAALDGDRAGQDASGEGAHATDDAVHECVSRPRGLIGWWPGNDNATEVVARNDAVWSGRVSYREAVSCYGFVTDS